MNLPAPFLQRMQRQLGADYPAYLRAMEQPAPRTLRVNTLKIGVEAFHDLFPHALLPAGPVPEGFLLAGEPVHIGTDPLHAAGLFYMQEASAMYPATLLNVAPGMRVLDLCAAPGGKTGQVAAALNGSGLLVANEIVPGRAAVLQENLVRLGVRNALITSMHPEALSALLPGYFDAVLVDAPCSGEGMFRKDPGARACWNEALVQACAVRQAHILDCAAGMLRPGGALVYSTCTFSQEENEDTIRAFLARNPSFSLLEEVRLYPHTSQGEGQYAARLEQTGGKAGRDAPAAVRPLPKEAQRAFNTFWNETLRPAPCGTPLLLEDGRVMLVPEGAPACMAQLRLRTAGVHAGEIRKGRFVPAHALAMAYAQNDFLQTEALTPAVQRQYLAGEAIRVQAGSGYGAACAAGFPLGWYKAVEGVGKNHLPKGLRMRGAPR